MSNKVCRSRSVPYYSMGGTQVLRCKGLIALQFYAMACTLSREVMNGLAGKRTF